MTRPLRFHHKNACEDASCHKSEISHQHGDPSLIKLTALAPEVYEELTDIVVTYGALFLLKGRKTVKNDVSTECREIF